MKKKLVCTECPIGCTLDVDIEERRVRQVQGNKCPKGETYAVAETEHPARVLTSAVLAQGLAVKMVPVRTDKPVPKENLLAAMAEVRKIRIKGPVKAGTTVARNLLGLGVDLVATRTVG